MLQIERRQGIVNYVNAHKNVSTAELSRVLRTSAVTIRADIKALAREGLIEKTYGGAASIQDRMNVEIPYQAKVKMNVREKQIIAAEAVKRIQPGDTILLDSGSTTLEIARRIIAPEVTVITNDVLIAKTLIDIGKVQVYLTGGKHLDHVYALHGSDTESYLSRIHVAKLFMGCDAMCLEWGISNRTMEEVATKKAMMKASDWCAAVADSSKIGKRVFSHLCDIGEVDEIITDDSFYQCTASEREQLATMGVRLTVCSAGQTR